MTWLLLSLGCGVLLYGLHRWQRRRAWLEGPHYVDHLRYWNSLAPHIPPVRAGTRAVKVAKGERPALRFLKRKGR